MTDDEVLAMLVHLSAAEDLLAALTSDVGLDGAACAGRAPLFDADIDGETSDERDDRHETAQRICRTCSVLNACMSTIATLPPRTDGVWAGQLHTGRTRQANKALSA